MTHQTVFFNSNIDTTLSFDCIKFDATKLMLVKIKIIHLQFTELYMKNIIAS